MNKKKKIFLLADDIRWHSGISTMAREIVFGTVHKYDWCCIGGAMKHPDEGKRLDLSQATKDKTGVDDAYVSLYCTTGYGNPDIVRQIIGLENPDVIMPFTDPRFWHFLWEIEHELRRKIPIAYLNIWDSTPAPLYNRPYYQSCDVLMAISKQTENINHHVLGAKDSIVIDDVIKNKSFNHKTLVTYVPHGINAKTFYPIVSDEEITKLADKKKELFKDKDYDFIVFYNNRNIRRKQTSDVILAYRTFCDSLTKEQAKKCCLLMHTAPQDEAGTDLIATKEAICPDYDILISGGKVDDVGLNQYYNIADVTFTLASNEGFGLGTAESIMAGTPIIATVTGGLQDQMGFVDDEGKPIQFTFEWGSNADGRYKTCGEWTFPLFPVKRILQGSIPTPYIFDDHSDWVDGAKKLKEVYSLGREERKRRGLVGRNWMIDNKLNSKYMSDSLIESMETTFQYWSPRKNYSLHTTEEYWGHSMPDGKMGFEIPKI